MKRIHQLAAAVALCVAGTAPVFAQSTTFQNGAFDNGSLTGWTTYGDVATRGGRVLTTTASLDNQDDTPLAAGFLNESGTPAVNFFESSTLAGIAVENFDIDGVAYEGSAIRQDFTAINAEFLTVTFDWAFLSTDTFVGDYGFVAVNDSVNKFVDSSSQFLTGNFLGTFVDASNTSWDWYQSSYTYQANANGAVSLTLGVIDIGDELFTSQVRFDNVAVSAVPEPETYAMLLAGLGLVGAFTRRRKAQASQA